MHSVSESLFSKNHPQVEKVSNGLHVPIHNSASQNDYKFSFSTKNPA